MNRISTLFPCAALLAHILVAGACGRGGDAAPGVERPSRLPQRQVVSVTWQKSVLVSGAAGDSTLISPYRLSADRGGVTLLDFYPRQVHRYDHAGRLRWRFGRQGAGPDEFRNPADLKVDPQARAWVLDFPNQRITVLDSTGRVAARVPLGSVPGHPHELVPLPSGTALLLVSGRPDRPFAVIGPNGSHRASMPYPSPEFARMHHLSSQQITARDPASGRWASAYRVGDGFVVFDGERWTGTRGWFVEPVPPAEVVSGQRGDGVSTRFKSDPTIAAISLTLSPERLYVLFGGTTRQRGQIVDSYSLRDGGYVESVALPHRVAEIAWYNGGLYTIRDDPEPELAFLKPNIALP